MAETSIQWADHSINPIRARNPKTNAVGHYCEKISPGCAFCYASKLQPRFNMPAFPGAGKRKELPLLHNDTLNLHDEMHVFLDRAKLQEVLRRKKPTKYFWCDMTDLFAEWVPDDWINACFRVMAEAKQHTHQILTKRSKRMLEYIGKRWDASHGNPIWHPLKNVWLGVSVEDQQRADERIPDLLQTPAALRFLSVEPLLGEIDLARVRHQLAVESFKIGSVLEGDDGFGLNAPRNRIDWVIVGGESGPSARPCELNWIRSIVAQCKAAGVPCFVKQLGSVPLFDRDEAKLYIRDRKGGDPREWPEALRVREFPTVKS